jgi:multicomponent Na+:H+ antiporter subunit F
MSIIGTEVSGVLGVALTIAGLFLVLAIVAAIWRLLTGPSVADRVVSLDMMTSLLVVFLVIFTMATGERAYIYAAIALALIGFLATVAFARFIERGHLEEPDDD